MAAKVKTSFEAAYPELTALYWAWDRNSLKPTEVGATSKREVFFRCPKGHEFSAPASAARGASMERFCRRCGSVGELNPRVVPLWDWERNGASPYEVPLGARGCKVYLVCAKSHSFLALVTATTEAFDGLCTVCKSFQETHPELMVYWAWEKNTAAGITPDAFPRRGASTAYFECEAGHEFEAGLQRAKTYRRSFCPSCASPSLQEAHPTVVERYWDFEGNSEDPSKLAALANGKFAFKCPAGHRFELFLSSIPKQKRELCPTCRLASHSFAAVYPHGSAFWDYERNELGPAEVYAGAGGSFAFRCSEGHRFVRPLKYFKEQELCPLCSSQESEVEREVARFVLEELGLRGVRNSRRVIPPYEVDLYLPRLAKAVEVNGDHRHSDALVSVKTRFPTGEAYHREKAERARAAGVELVFVWAHGWTSHREAVESELREFLETRGAAREGFPLLSRWSSVIDLPCPLCTPPQA